MQYERLKCRVMDADWGYQAFIRASKTLTSGNPNNVVWLRVSTADPISVIHSDLLAHDPAIIQILREERADKIQGKPCIAYIARHPLWVTDVRDDTKVVEIRIVSKIVSGIGPDEIISTLGMDALMPKGRVNIEPDDLAGDSVQADTSSVFVHLLSEPPSLGIIYDGIYGDGFD